MVHVPKCQHPVVIFSKAAVQVLERVRTYHVLFTIHYTDYKDDYKGKRTKKEVLIAQKAYTIPSDYIGNRHMFRSLMPIKRYFSLCGFGNIDKVGVIDELGQWFPLFQLVKCNKCDLCKESKSFEWSTRCALEAEAYDRLPLMLTLTYNDTHLPSDGVRKDHVQKFLDRFRKQLERNGFNPKFRYVAVSEYGSKRHRPHYHLLLFGLDNQLSYYNQYQKRYCLSLEGSKLLNNAWSFYNRKSEEYETFGYHFAKFCNNTKAGAYCCKYMRKGSNAPHGQNPCFFLTSRRDGCIGWKGFLYHSFDKLLRKCPTSPTFQYNSRFDGKATKLAIPGYFIKKVFPSFCDAIPVKLRRNMVSYLECLEQLRSWPKLSILTALKQDSGHSIQTHYWDVSTAVKTRLGFVRHEVNDSSVDGNYVYGLWYRFGLQIDSFRSKYRDFIQNHRDDLNLRSLYYCTRPQNEYNIPMELDLAYSRTLALREAERDSQ